MLSFLITINNNSNNNKVGERKLLEVMHMSMALMVVIVS